MMMILLSAEELYDSIKNEAKKIYAPKVSRLWGAYEKTSFFCALFYNFNVFVAQILF